MPLDKLTFDEAEDVGPSERLLPTRPSRVSVPRADVDLVREAGRSAGFVRGEGPQSRGPRAMEPKPHRQTARDEEVVARRPGRPRGPKRTNLTLTMPVATANHLKRFCDEEMGGVPYWEALHELFRAAGHPVPGDVEPS